MGKTSANNLPTGENAPGAYPIHDQRPIAYRGRGRQPQQGPTRQPSDQPPDNSHIPPELRAVAPPPDDSHIPPELRAVAPQPPPPSARASLPRQHSNGIPRPQTRPTNNNSNASSISTRVLEILRAGESGDFMPSSREGDRLAETAAAVPRLDSHAVIVLSDDDDDGDAIGRTSTRSSTRSQASAAGNKKKLFLVVCVLVSAIIVGVVGAITFVFVFSNDGDDSNDSMNLPDDDDQPATTNAPSQQAPFQTSPSPTTAPSPTPRIDLIRAVLEPISGESIHVEESIQHQALTWLATKDSFSLPWIEEPEAIGGESLLIERYVMIVLFMATGGPTTAWMEYAHNFMDPNLSTCDWGPTDLGQLRFRIRCDASGHMTDIFIDNFGLFGSLPEEIGFLTNLSILRVHENPDLVGKLPDLSRLTNLDDLRLYSNSLTGDIPSTLYGLRSLTHLDLSDNALRGTLSTKLAALEELEQLYLHDNVLEGSLPSSLGSLRSLDTMIIFTNLLTGAIPTTLGLLTALTYLDLSYNYLSGTIPTELGELSGLVLLFLEHNDLEGNVPSTFSNLARLAGIYLHRNNLVGSFAVICGDPLVEVSADCTEVDCSCCSICCGPFTGGFYC